MIKKITLLLFFVSFIAQSQIQIDAPWSQELQKKGGKTSELTLKEISKSAEAYFATIDRNKKGSGLKPFERWKYHWGFYTDASGKIKPSSDLWDAWEVKQARKANSKNDNTGNWAPVGPFQSSNTYSSSALKSSGQGRVNVVAVDPSNPNTYYVGAPAGGIWKSTDAGVNWAPLTDYLPQIGVSGIAIHPTDSNTIYIATGDDDAGDSYAVGVWKSIDGGATWNATGAIPGNPSIMNDIYINPNNTETVVVATSTGVQKSTDGGATWKTTLSLLVNTQSNVDLKMKPGNPNIFYVVARDKFYKSIDGGSNFIEKTITGLTSSSRLAMDVTIANDAYIYLVSYLRGTGPNNNGFNGVYKSVDSGETFTKTTETTDIFGGSQAWYDLAITVSDVNAEIVYVGVLDIYKSTNGGNAFSKITNWTQPDSQSYVHADIHFLRFIDGKFFAGTDGGIYISTNEGLKFTDLTENLSISQFYKISVSVQDSSILAGGLQDNGGFAFNNNSWVNYHGGDGMEGNVDPTNKNTHYGFTQYGGYLSRTVNNGANVNLQLGAPEAETGADDDGGEWVTPMAINSKGEVYAAYSKLYKLVSDAWEQTAAFSFNGDADEIEIDPKNDNNIFVAQEGNLFRTNDAGVTFTQIPFFSGEIKGMEVSPKDSNTIWIVTNSGVFKSTNINSSNPTFNTVGTGIPSEGKFVVRYHERSGNNTIYLGTALGVYYFNDSQNEWQVFDTNLPNVAVRDLEINERDSKIFAGTYGRGVFVSDLPRVLPAKDINLSSIANLDNTINCNTSVAPSIIVKNQGTGTLNQVVIEYSFNDASPKSTFTWTGTLNSLQSQEISLPTATFALGTYKIEAKVVLENDDYQDDNSIISYFKVNNSISEPYFLNQFDSKSANDILLTETIGATTTSVWQRGVPAGTLLKSVVSSRFVYGTNLGGNYPELTTSYLYSNCYDLSVMINPIIKFQMAFDIEKDWDYLVFEYSRDAGKTWNILGSADSPNWYTSAATTDDSNSSTLPGRQWTGEGENTHPLGGTNATLREYSHDLSSIGFETNVIFRFKLYSDEASTEEGVIIDDFGVTGTSLATNDVVVQNELLVYPNPSKDTFNLSWNFVGNADISVYNYLGKTILSKNNIKENKYQIDLSNQSKGLYFIKINVDGKQAVKKVILE